MAYTQTDLDTIRAHIASGVKTVRYADGRSVEYHSLSEMLAAEKVIAATVGITGTSVRKKFASFSNGC